jgi:hypothetical protein
MVSQNDARRHAWVRVVTHDGDPKPLGAQQPYGAVALETDDVGHNEGVSLLATIHEERDVRRLGVGRRILSDHRAARVLTGADLRAYAQSD